MRFLSTTETKKEIQRLMRTSVTAELAVAFWGHGAVEELGIDKSEAKIRIICNLALGGTNPRVIEALRKRKANTILAQCDRLHGKVYLFENAAIIGSSNASANGLALEGAELKHWAEANILVKDENVLHDISAWMANLETRPILKSDLERATKV